MAAFPPNDAITIMYSRHFRMLACAALLPLLPMLTLAAHPDALPAQADPALAAQVREFLESFIDPSSTPDEQAKFFTEDADYYGRGPTGAAEIAKDIARNSRRWPARAYRVVRIDYITPDPSTGRIFVSYTLDYEVANSRQAVRGSANYGAVIVDLDTDPKIAWIRENIKGKKPAARSGE